jgi:hypothetical protein
MKFIIDKFFHFGDVFSGYYENITKRNANVDGYMCQVAIIFLLMIVKIIRVCVEYFYCDNVSTVEPSYFAVFIVISKPSVDWCSIIINTYLLLYGIKLVNYFYSIRSFFNSSDFKIKNRNDYSFYGFLLFVLFSLFFININNLFYRYSNEFDMSIRLTIIDLDVIFYCICIPLYLIAMSMMLSNPITPKKKTETKTVT